MGTTVGQPILGRCAWLGAELASSTDWIRRFTPAELAELDRALASVKTRGLAWRQITREDFPLTRLGTALAAVRDELEYGRGLVLLRGLPSGATPRTSYASSTGASAPTSARPGTRTLTAS